MIVTTTERLYTFEEYLAYDNGTDNRYELLYEETLFTGDRALISSTFPELSLTVEQVLAAGNI